MKSQQGLAFFWSRETKGSKFQCGGYFSGQVWVVLLLLAMAYLGAEKIGIETLLRIGKAAISGIKE